MLKLNASVPTGEKKMWFFPIESKYSTAWSRATFDGSYTCGGNVVDDGAPEEVGGRRIEDADRVVRRRRHVGVEVVADAGRARSALRLLT